jgi:hypothetical protein
VSGAFYVAAAGPDPANVTTVTGRVGYELFNNSRRTGTNNPVLIAQLVADDRLRVETFPPGASLNQGFTASALVYIR